MITSVFVGILLSIVCVISTIDMFVYRQPFLLCMKKVLLSEKGLNEAYINIALLLGFLYSIGADIRLRKKKNYS